MDPAKLISYLAQRARNLSRTKERGPGGSDEFLETEEQPQKMPEERLCLGGDVARPTVPKDGKDPWE